METTPGTLTRPTFITVADWNTVLTHAVIDGTNPYLIAAIGWHETHWGQLGAGKSGYTLGVGVYSDTNVNHIFAGLAKQLDWATPRMGKAFGLHPTQDDIEAFGRQIWRPGDPAAWSTSVWTCYLQFLLKYSPDFDTFADIPSWAREPVAAMLSAGFCNTPFGSSDFYRSLVVTYRIYVNLKAFINPE